MKNKCFNFGPKKHIGINDNHNRGRSNFNAYDEKKTQFTSPNSRSPSRSNSVVRSNSKTKHTPEKNINNKANFNINELISNINDDQKTLIIKNTKLRNLLVQASTKLNEASEKIKLKNEEHHIEKSKILNELDRISLNYKTYAEAYKKYSLIEEELKNLKKDYQHNYKVLISYEESLR